MIRIWCQRWFQMSPLHRLSAYRWRSLSQTPAALCPGQSRWRGAKAGTSSQVQDHRVHIFTRDETGLVCLPIQLERISCNFNGDGKCNESVGGGVQPTPSPARANFTLMTECTPESSCCYSVYKTMWSQSLVDFGANLFRIQPHHSRSTFFLSNSNFIKMTS
jgi:hypothetical protein